MKKLTFLILLTGLLSCQEKNLFTLSGEIEGLQPGDTLFLAEYQLPDWEELSVDTFYVAEPNEFSIKKALPHTSFFLLNHHPKDAPVIKSHIRGATMLAQPGDFIRVKGSIDLFGSLYKIGGLYNDSLVARLDSLERASDSSLANIYRKIEEYRESEQQDSVQKYADMYNRYRSPQELRDLRNYIKDEVNGNEYAAYMYLSNLHDVTGTQLEERLAKFTPEIQASYIGQQLSGMLKVMKNIEPGNVPSDFTVTDMNGNRLKLSDYRGKYVLIYNWGLCPGTIWVHPKLLELYDRFHEKGLEVIGFTRYNFFEVHVDLKEIPDIAPLFNQPWTTVLTDAEGNKFMEKDYYFAGVPILMLISPEGKTLFRGYSEVYAKAKEVLEENLGD